MTLDLRSLFDRLYFIQIKFFRALVEHHSLSLFIINTKKYFLIIVLNQFLASPDHAAGCLSPFINLISLLFGSDLLPIGRLILT